MNCKNMDEADLWVRIGIIAVVCFVIGVLIFGCDDNTLKQDKVTIYDGNEVTIINDGDYKIKVMVKFAGSISAAKYYCESIEIPAAFEFIKLKNCKHFNGDLYIPYNRMKWFTYQDYNGEDDDSD